MPSTASATCRARGQLGRVPDEERGRGAASKAERDDVWPSGCKTRASGTGTKIGDLNRKPCFLLAYPHAFHGNDGAIAGEVEERLTVELSC